MHLLNVKRFTIPPISVINFDQTYHKYNDNIEIKNEKFEQSRLQHLLKSMIKNFDFDNNFQKYNKEIQNIDLDKELFDFNNDIKEIDQSAMFTEYILFKYIDKLILVCAHTDEFHSLNKYLIIESRIKQSTQRFHDDYIVKEFFNCWKDYTVEQARIAELRRKRITIDFREFCRHRQLINYDNNDNKNYFISLSNLITHNDEILSLIRERIHFLNRTKTYINIYRDELATKELLLNSSLLQRGTIKDLDKLILDYYASIEQQNIKILSKSSSSIIKLPMLKPSSFIYKSNSKLSRQTMAISQ
ncbi:unnamed protein product [Rotaria sp. Silwood1]|nr:unnamed protein product [Rotaria sp. Silwood1]CAF4967474.1 unnamed protein product [Rotaria sp. Silwood1]